MIPPYLHHWHWWYIPAVVVIDLAVEYLIWCELPPRLPRRMYFAKLVTPFGFFWQGLRELAAFHTELWKDFVKINFNGREGQ